jgi:hypothetical protein
MPPGPPELLMKRTVSQICSFTDLFSATSTVFVANSTPTVTLYCSEKSPLMYRMSMDDLPTPEFNYHISTLLTKHNDLEHEVFLHSERIFLIYIYQVYYLVKSHLLIQFDIFFEDFRFYSQNKPNGPHSALKIINKKKDKVNDQSTNRISSFFLFRLFTFHLLIVRPIAIARSPVPILQTFFTVLSP